METNTNNENRNRKEIFGIVNRPNSEQSYWTRIGVAFENRDGSWNLLFNFIPTDPQTRVQLREPKPTATQ